MALVCLSLALVAPVSPVPVSFLCVRVIYEVSRMLYFDARVS